MTNLLNSNNGNSRYSIDQFLQDLSSHDFVRSFPTNWRLSNHTSNENRSVDQLKIKIDCFFRDHSNVVIDIKNYFYDEIIIYSLKRALKIPFNQLDMNKTERLLQQFFSEHEQNIRIIYNYFIDDIKRHFIKNPMFSFTLEFPQINSILNRGGYEAFLLLLKTKGASFLTSLLYRTHIVLNNNENAAQQPTLPTETTNHQIPFLPLVAYLTFLFVIFGWRVFFIMFYFIIGSILIIFFVYLVSGRQTR